MDSSNFRERKKGFTVIELLVVVAIVAILIGIIAAVVNEESRKAKYARARAEMAQFIKVASVAKGETGKSMAEITGSLGWTMGPCMMGSYPSYDDIRNISDSSQCYIKWVTALNNVQAAAPSLTGITSMTRDPWGSPYLLNEQEYITPLPCYTDIFMSAGPDGRPDNGDDIRLHLPPVLNPNCQNDY